MTNGEQKTPSYLLAEGSQIALFKIAQIPEGDNSGHLASDFPAGIFRRLEARLAREDRSILRLRCAVKIPVMY